MASTSSYVFTALVSDKNDPVELMSYAIYKADKNEIAESCALRNLPPQVIDIEIKKFHDLVLKSPTILANYKVRAKALAVSLHANIKEDLKKEGMQDFIDRADKTVKTEKSWYHHLGAWMADTVRSVLSAIFIIILFGGIYSLFLTKEERTNLYSAAGQSLVDVASGEIPVVDKYREEKAKREREAQERAAKVQAAKEQAAKPQN